MKNPPEKLLEVARGAAKGVAELYTAEGDETPTLTAAAYFAMAAEFCAAQLTPEEKETLHDAVMLARETIAHSSPAGDGSAEYSAHG